MRNYCVIVRQLTEVFITAMNGYLGIGVAVGPVLPVILCSLAGVVAGMVQTPFEWLVYTMAPIELEHLQILRVRTRQNGACQ
jgi:hypothetical protein